MPSLLSSLLMDVMDESRTTVPKKGEPINPSNAMLYHRAVEGLTVPLTRNPPHYPWNFVASEDFKPKAPVDPARAMTKLEFILPQGLSRKMLEDGGSGLKALLPSITSCKCRRPRCTRQNFLVTHVGFTAGGKTPTRIFRICFGCRSLIPIGHYPGKSS